MPAIKIFVAHAGECEKFPDEFSKDCYELIDGRGFPLNDQLNEASVIKSLVDNPPDVGYIGVAHYRRHLVLPETLDTDKIYCAKAVYDETNGELFSRYHSAEILRKFIAGIEDPLVKFWVAHHLEETVSYPRNCFVMPTCRFAGSFADWFTICYRSATALCDECKKFGRYNRRIPGFLMERAVSAYIAFDHRDVVPCKLTNYLLSSPWQRGSDEMDVFIGGKWK